MSTETTHQPSLLFETSWEVCNKVGGIYAVLSTKARTLQSLYGDKVIFVGPDVWTSDSPSPYFKESSTLLKAWRLSNTLPKGVSVRVGRWQVPGKPIAVLVKFDALYETLPQLFGKMWELYGVDSLHAYGDYPEACAFSHAAALVIESICRFNGLEKGEGVLAHFDEWTTGMGLLHVKHELPKAATVFTTHATSIGRSICGNGKQLYAYFEGYNGDQMARELNMEAKHSLEKTAAHQADCFTTVSEVTARECEQLLDIRPHVTPNGFEKDFVPKSAKGLTQARNKARTALLNMINALTGTNLTSDNAYLVATSGRCEYRNKGIDVFLDSCNIMSHQLTDTDRTMVCLVMVPAWSDKARPELIEALAGNQPAGLPNPVITHNLHNYDSDAVIGHINRLGFTNRPTDRLMVIYVPCYLDGSEGLFGGLTYYDLLPGLDATVFPSYYEPWGYTPMESVAFGVPTFTTSLAGFGLWVNSEFGTDNFEAAGVVVNERNDGNYNELCHNIASQLINLMRVDQTTAKQLRANAAATADRASWAHFMDFYLEAYNIALAAAAKRK